MQEKPTFVHKSEKFIILLSPFLIICSNRTLKPATMKSFVTTLCLTLWSTTVVCQNIGINVTGIAPDQSALLDIDGSGLPANSQRGVLIPRVALMATNMAAPVNSPATSLLVYNTATVGSIPYNVSPGFYYWDGTKWRPLLDGTQGCLPGLVDFGYFSIEQNLHPATDFFSAVTLCHSLGSRMRLPRVGEWYIACSSGLVPTMSTDDEWVDDSVHEDNFLTMGYGGWCDGTHNEYYATARAFRCVCEH